MASPRTHHRSASWTLGGAGAASGTPGSRIENIGGSESTTFDSLRSVICEIVPGLSAGSTSSIPPQNTASDVSLHNRTETLNVREGLMMEDVERGNVYSSSGAGTHVYRRSDSHTGSSFGQATAAGSMASNGAAQGVDNGEADENGGSTLQPFLKWFEKGLPFCLLLAARLLWEHRLGVLVLAGLLVTFLHANRTIRRQVELKERRSLFSISLIFFFLGFNLLSIYYVFQSQQLHNCFSLQPPRLEPTLLNALWAVMINDFAIKFFTMMLKCIIAMVYTAIIPYRRKGKYYLILENLSHFYRTLVPIPVWISYFADHSSTGLPFTVISIIVYVIIKCLAVMRKARRLHDAVRVFLKDRRYGSRPQADALAQAGNACPICQEDLREPTMLPCGHIFCDDCVSMWFDRERTCPLCRALVAEDPLWRDGATAIAVHIF